MSKPFDDVGTVLRAAIKRLDIPHGECLTICVYQDGGPPTSEKLLAERQFYVSKENPNAA